MNKGNNEQPKKARRQAVRLLQISDSHLFQDPDGRLIGMDTADSLARVIELVKKNEFTQNSPAFDLVLATGDISQDGSLQSYQSFDAQVGDFQRPIYYLPGNHDNLEVMKHIADQDHAAPCTLKRENWSIIMLDSKVSEEVYGQLKDEQLRFLKKALNQTKGSHVAVCLHHHPLPMNSTWLDGVALKEADHFFDIIDQFDHVRAVICGHVHQENKQERLGVAYYFLPSTCIQFKPLSHDFELDTLNPGYRWFELYDDGSIETAVCRITDYHFVPDKTVSGY